MEEEFDEIIKNLSKDHPIEDMVSFNDLNIQEKLKQNAYFIAQYSNFLSAEKREYERLEEMYDALVGNRYDYYRFEMDKSLTKVEIEKYYIPQDKKVRAMKRILAKQRHRIEFFEMCVRSLKAVGWNMKHFIDAERRL